MQRLIYTVKGRELVPTINKRFYKEINVIREYEGTRNAIFRP